ncbi:universal stress protein [Maridesulfovibrio hydrothermalis]|uniref:UspA domain-containing protein n=1 Tax=Maridesulfovibrio hydrothermalis AM13 = DSM 14728 TaxID=1121451 RepID=L0RBF1_9BACT|nr:universal stress protein [Maridesulfovibrio hydrothermalis]CCO24118.1 protein of unknown function [Maridesulfovibrio hydrothermalis AM13 = DSM 14728]
MKHILLATHGTPGAQRAEKLAAQWAEEYSAKITVLSIINDAWGDMTCDDWLNTSTTRNKFGSYVAEEIAKEIGAVWDRLKIELSGKEVNFISRGGKLDEVLARTAEELEADLIIMGAWQKEQAPGFRDRFENKKLHTKIQCPVVVAP